MKNFHVDPCTFISPRKTWGFKGNLPTLKFIMNFRELSKLKSSGNRNAMHHSKRTSPKNIYQTVIILNMLMGMHLAVITGDRDKTFVYLVNIIHKC